MNPNPNPSRDQCFNCGRPNASHIAMYCSDKIQQHRRCEDPKCWAACRNSNDHSAMCAENRIASLALANSSPLHRPVRRFTILTESSIEQYTVGNKTFKNGPVGLNTTSIIAEDINLKWENKNKFVITGPKTMYFRVLIAVGRYIIARVDVCCESSVFVRLPETQLENCRDVTKIQQTVAILRVEGGDVEIKAGDKCFIFNVVMNDDGTAEWTKFEETTEE